MSFSKAKLKRFNEITVTDSPYRDKMSERKDAIKNFFKDHYKDKNAKKMLAKELSDLTDSDSAKSNIEPNVKPKSSALDRLFRTPSLPHRLRFNRHHNSTDVTPKEKRLSSKELFLGGDVNDQQQQQHQHLQQQQQQQTIDALNVEITNKTEALQEQENHNEELKEKIHEMHYINMEQIKNILQQNNTIIDLEKELNDSNVANEFLVNISENAISKINSLENDIKMILKNHENEIDFLIKTNTNLELTNYHLLNKNKELKNEIKNLEIELDGTDDELEVLKMSLKDEEEKLLKRDTDCKLLLNENMELYQSLEQLKRHANDDRQMCASENKKIHQEIDAIRSEKHNMLNELAINENLINALQNELDLQRDLIVQKYNEDLEMVRENYEQQIVTLKEVNDMQINEIESICILEKSKQLKEHIDIMTRYECEKNDEIKMSNELADEKIRVSHEECEKKIASLEQSIQQTIEREKQLWKMELDKCQKIAENEIMQSEFEKQDLKTLLESANDLLREKDEKYEELEIKLRKEHTTYNKARKEFECELDDVRIECKRIMTEKYNYQLTLNNTRSTVNILMERLKKSDTDVEVMKNEIELITKTKLEFEHQFYKLNDELKIANHEIEQYRNALTALRNSSSVMERQCKEKESVFEKLMSSEEETLETVNKIGQLLNNKLEENIGKYFDMYNAIKLKYDSRETYIKDMKSLLDEFAASIELARLEMDLKDNKLLELQEENTNLKLEILTYKDKCEQLEIRDNVNNVKNNNANYNNINNNNNNNNDCTTTTTNNNNNETVSNLFIEDIINQLETEIIAVQSNDELSKNNKEITTSMTSSDVEKLNEENILLKEKLIEKMKQIEFLQEMVELENLHAAENLDLKKKIRLFEEKIADTHNYKSSIIDDHHHHQHHHIMNGNSNQLKKLKNKQNDKELTPHKMSSQNKIGGTPNKIAPTTPKTPKTPKIYAGKENLSPAISTMNRTLSPAKPIKLKIRNN